MNVRFRIGRVRASVSEEDAVRLVTHLLDRETLPAARAATLIMVAIKEQVISVR